jgi:hypothetical protein
MKWSVSSLLMSAAVVGMPCIPRIAAASGSIEASGGRITFTGAIVEPTCGVSTEHIATMVANSSTQNLSRRIACTVANALTSAAPIYAVTVVKLTGSEPDRVLQYFNKYVKASQANASGPVLVTQTYE